MLNYVFGLFAWSPRSYIFLYSVCIPFEYNHIALFISISRGEASSTIINKDYYDYGFDHYCLYRPRKSSLSSSWPQKAVLLLHIQGIVGNGETAITATL